MTETLTDEERRHLENHAKQWPDVAKALRIIDSHAADRLAWLDQMAQLKRERDEARIRLSVSRGCRKVAQSEVARLTEALAESEADKVELYAKARCLREALAAAEELKTALNTDCDRPIAAARHDRALLDAAEATNG